MAFHKLHQKPEQSVRQFYSEVVQASTECDFGKDYCSQCCQKAVNDQLLQKLVFSTTREEARKEMLKHDHLDVESAKAELEKDESLKATESALRADAPIPTISAMAKDKTSHKRSKSGSRFHKRTPASPDRRKCMCCGHPYHDNRDDCPAKGHKCRSCGKQGHFAKVCLSSRSKQHQTPGALKKLGPIIRAIGSTTEYVTVDVEGHQIPSVIDTGSDWICCGPKQLQEYLHESPLNLLDPTPEMLTTTTASGDH